jgi:ABC-type phosphate transport system substrate-binding protein
MRCKLLGTSAFVALMAVGASYAQAQVTTTVYGGGSSLAAPYYTQQFSLFETGNPTVGFSYFTVGSGAAQSAFLNNFTSIFSITASGASVDFGASDASLSTTQISGWSSSSVGQSVAGNLIQVPTFGTPITVAYNAPTSAGLGANLSLHLTDSQLCGIYSGKITDWHALNSSVPAGTTIKVVYRADGSGTSFLLTQHLAAVCTSTNSNVTFTANTNFAGEFTTVPANFTGVSLSGGVQSAINVSGSNAIGYLSPDFTAMVSSVSAPVVAEVASDAAPTTFVAPTPTNTKNSLATGTVTVGADPAGWVPAIANPAASATSYPIVGYTTWELAQCYSSTHANQASALVTFLTDLYNGNFDTTLIGNGFTPVPRGAGSISTAIKSNLLTSSNSLGIGNTTACSGKTGR